MTSGSHSLPDIHLAAAGPDDPLDVGAGIKPCSCPLGESESALARCGNLDHNSGTTRTKGTVAAASETDIIFERMKATAGTNAVSGSPSALTTTPDSCRVVLPNRSALEQGQGQARSVWAAKIAPQLSTYMGQRFEELCRQYIRVHPVRLTHRLSELSVWWRASDELDIVGHESGTVVLAAEAKWRNDSVDMDMLQTLQRRVALLPKVAPDAQLVLFSKSGFTRRVQAARTPYVVLLTPDDLMP